MTNRYLVTGGAGFVGATVVRSLLARGDEVVVLDSGAATGFVYLDGLDAEIVSADIRDAAAVDAAVARCQGVVHLAAQVSVPESIAEPLLDRDVNVTASVALLEAARHHDVRRLVFASSNAVVGGHPPPSHEGLVPLPVSPYGAAKAAVEAYLIAYREAFGIEGVALRFANAYGPWSGHKRSVISAFLVAYLAGGPLTIRGTGGQTRDFVYVDDLAAAVLAALDAPANVVAGEVFQVGTGVETTLIDLVHLLFEVGGGEVPMVHEPPSPGDVPRNVSDISKAERILGYSPRVSLREGLARTLEWFRTAS